MTYKIKRPVNEEYIPLSDKLERQMDKKHFEKETNIRNEKQNANSKSEMSPQRRKLLG